MTSKRIAMISEHASPLGALGGADGGGQNVYVGQLAVHLARMGYHIDVFTRRDGAELPEVVEWQDGARIINVPAGPASFVRKEDLMPFMAEFQQWMLEHWQDLGGYDLVHANFWTSGLVAAGLKRATGTPFVITFHALGKVRLQHQSGADEFPDERAVLEEMLVREAAAVIAECPQDQDDLCSLYRADPARISIIPCGFDASELHPVPQDLARSAIGALPHEPLLLSVGRLVPRKGVDTIIKALAVLRREHGISARLLVVGGEAESPDPAFTPEIGRLHTVARESGVIDLVTFTGRRSHSDLKLYYSAADAFVTMPWYEPFGMTPVEAMACGVPVIGARVGGIKYSIQENETGFLVEPDNPRQLADRIATLLSSQRLRQKMGRAGLARVRRSFQWASISESVAKLYERVLDDPEPAEIAEMERGFDSALEALRRSRVSLPRQTAAIAGTIAMAFERGRKLLICGNGGSAADAQHFAAEFTGRFCLKDRRPFPAIALTADSAFLTAWANDIGFEDVFSRQVEAFGQAGDVLVGISTSGRSPNVLRAFEMARRRGLTCIALGAGDGGAMADLADELLAVPETDTQRVQEVHLLLMHLICAAVEKRLAAAPPVDGPPTRIRLVRPAVIAERKPALVTA